MSPRELKAGEIVQLNPSTVKNKAFTACLAVVDEPKTFGAQLIIFLVGETRDEAPLYTCYRATFDEIEPTGGVAVWLPSAAG